MFEFGDIVSHAHSDSPAVFIQYENKYICYVYFRRTGQFTEKNGWNPKMEHYVSAVDPAYLTLSIKRTKES